MLSSRVVGIVRSSLPLAAVVVMLSLVGLLPAVGEAGPQPLLAVSEPAAAAGFIASQRAHDAAKASRVTSPLYRAEMERRGRGAAWPLSGLWADATARLDFSFVGAVSDSGGFTYALYTARRKGTSAGQSPASVWRIDLDPRGKVIWGEAARVLDSAGFEPVGMLRGQLAASGQSWRSVMSRTGAGLQLVMGIRSYAGDAYVAVRSTSGDPNRIGFAQEDASGQLGRSYWSYYEVTPAGVAPARPGAARHVSQLTDADAQTLHSYLGAIGWSPGGM